MNASLFCSIRFCSHGFLGQSSYFRVVWPYGYTVMSVCEVKGLGIWPLGNAKSAPGSLLTEFLGQSTTKNLYFSAAVVTKCSEATQIN